MLPKKQFFYSHLTDTHISEIDYQHAQNVWCSFNIHSLGKYSDLYLKTDIVDFVIIQ